MVLYILGHEWRLHVVEHLGDFGECNVDDRTILIRGKQSEEQFLDTCLHEICHAIFFLQDIKDSDAEETTVKRLAIGLTSVAIDPRNRNFLKGINDRLGFFS